MKTTGLTLLLPAKNDEERDAVGWAWQRAGGNVLRLDRFWDPPELDPATVRVYGSDAFCQVLEQKLGFALLSPRDDLIATLPSSLLGRSVKVVTLNEVARLALPYFVKSTIPKLIPSRVYTSKVELEAAIEGLDPATTFLASEPVRIEAEIRAFVLAGEMLDAAFYEGEGDVAHAQGVVAEAALLSEVPSAVIDVARTLEGNWIVLEFNAAWGAGLNGCEATKVLPAIASASAPRA